MKYQMGKELCDGQSCASFEDFQGRKEGLVWDFWVREVILPFEVMEKETL